MVKCEHPFGITPEIIGEFNQRKDAGKINRPVRDTQNETFWDFVTAPCDGSPFEPEALRLLGREG